MNDCPGVVFAEVAAVEEVHVDGRRNDAVRRQQLTEVQVSGRGVLQRIVVAVSEDGKRKRTPTARDADMAVQRNVGVRKRPRRKAKVGEGRDIDSSREVGRIGRIVDVVLRQCRHSRIVHARRGVNDRVEGRKTRQTGIVQGTHNRSETYHCVSLNVGD